MKEIYDYIDELEDLVIELQQGLTSNPAVNPENGGDGEYKKFTFLRDYIKKWDFDEITDIFVPDERVSDKVRPSLIAGLKGEDQTKTLWIITHIDVVPAGELNLWVTDPFKAVIRDDRIFGRGTEDNQQSLVSSLLAVKTILDNKIKPRLNIKLLFVSDEEVGSDYGIKWILKNKNIFSKGDLILTPDGGHPDGINIEIAEKSILWVLFKIFGKQAHGSRPDLGINTARASSFLCVRMEKLREIFNDNNELFDIPYSTFEPTRRKNSITNMNTISGEEELGFDCRILPNYDLGIVKEEIGKIVKTVEDDFMVKIEIEYLQDLQAAPPTSADSPIVKMLQESIKKVLGIDARPVGIGGGTVAAYLRMEGYEAALWSTIDVCMHSPNEYSKISNTLRDAKVFVDLMLAEH